VLKSATDASSRESKRGVADISFISGSWAGLRMMDVTECVDEDERRLARRKETYMLSFKKLDFGWLEKNLYVSMSADDYNPCHFEPFEVNVGSVQTRGFHSSARYDYYTWLSLGNVCFQFSAVFGQVSGQRTVKNIFLI